MPFAVYPAQGVPLALPGARTGMCVGAESLIRQAWPSLLKKKEMVFSPFEVTWGSARPFLHTEPLFGLFFSTHSAVTSSCCICAYTGLNIPRLEEKNQPGKRFKCHLLGISPYYIKGDKDELVKPHPSPLAYDPNWVMSNIQDLRSTASARQGRSICQRKC